MKMFANLSQFIYHSGPPQPSAAPFDDGLTEIARLIAREDLIKADALPAATTIATERGPRAGVVMPPSMFAATDEVIEEVRITSGIGATGRPRSPILKYRFRPRSNIHLPNILSRWP